MKLRNDEISNEIDAQDDEFLDRIETREKRQDKEVYTVGRRDNAKRNKPKRGRSDERFVSFAAFA